MAKKIKRIAKLEIMAGQAKPGPLLASLGINIPQFTQQFNAATKDRSGEIVPFVITAYDDKTFDFELKTTPVAFLLKKACKIEKGSPNAKLTKVATISLDEIKKIAEYKLVDLNARSLESAIKTVAATAKNIGIVVEGMDESNEVKK